MKYQSVRGTKDVLPPESSEWQRLENTSRDVFRIFRYREIRTPVIEETGLFIKTVGGDTDIVQKEMFSFLDRGERDISLRPEGTAPIIRAYLENNLDKTEPFQKLYYIGPMSRAERPQAGRLRQFQQIGLEAIGSDSPALDAEVIGILTKLLIDCGISKYELRLNNLGCREDKKKLSAILRELFSKKGTEDLLCEDCKRRLKVNPLRVLDCKNENCRAIVRDKFKEVQFLCQDCKKHFDEVLKFLNLLKIPYKLDPFIVRGLDYYTRTVFEVTHDGLGSQNAIGAGGRYDNLISDMGGPSLGACGFALGQDRMMMARDNEGAFTDKTAKTSATDVFMVTLGKAAYEKGFLLLNELRENGICCDIDYSNSSLKSQMRTADKAGAKFVLIIGDNEIEKGSASCKNMAVKEEQFDVKFTDVARLIKERLSSKEKTC